MKKNITFILMGATGFTVAASLWSTSSGRVAALAQPETEQTASGTGEQAEQKEQEGQALADSIMSQWKRKNPDRVQDWVAEEKERHTIQPPADNSEILRGGEQGASHVYGQYTERDLVIWAREAEKLVVEGSRIFHDGDALGSTVGVSCDMCHPHAANTHPETYPKFQVQMGRVALLRDMINWCIEQPVRGTQLAPDDASMLALEAYIYAQRKGEALNYGKH